MFQFRSTKRLGAACAALGMLGVCGCVEPTTEDDDDALRVTSAAQTASSAPDPEEAYFANVTANGTGCPRGSTSTKISEDGLTFTTTFTAYKVTVERDIDFDVRTCQLGIKVHSPQNRSFAVETFSYRGSARLDPGVTSRQVASYYFQGTAVDPSKEKQTALAGPYEGPFELRDKVIVGNRIWSPCGVDRELNVRTRLELRNGATRGSGFMSLNEIEGAAEIEVRMVSRPCDGPRTPPGDPVTAAPSDGPSSTSPPVGTPPSSTPSTGSTTTEWGNPPSVEPPSDTPSTDSTTEWGNPPSVEPPSDTPSTDSTTTEWGNPPSEPPSEPPSADPPTSSSESPSEPTLITIIPGVIRRGQSFSVSWSSASSDPASTRYRVRITRFGDVAGTLIWESPETALGFLEVPATVLSAAGEYDVVVVARAGSRAAFSAPALVRVVASP